MSIRHLAWCIDTWCNNKCRETAGCPKVCSCAHQICTINWIIFKFCYLQIQHHRRLRLAVSSALGASHVWAVAMVNSKRWQGRQRRLKWAESVKFLLCLRCKYWQYFLFAHFFMRINDWWLALAGHYLSKVQVGYCWPFFIHHSN